MAQWWAYSLGLGIRYEHCPYAELWQLTAAFRIIRVLLKRPRSVSLWSASPSSLLPYSVGSPHSLPLLMGAPVPSSSSPPRSLLRVGTDHTFPSSEGSSSFIIWLVTSFFFPDCVSRARIYTHRVISEVSFVVMARGDISVMPANVPEDMDWVEDVVLLSKSVVDEELLASFREAHTVCSTVEEESKYELVAPTSEERVCYYNLGHPEERHFIYMAVEGFRPFFENERGEYQFRLYWYSGPESPKFDFNDLDKEDQEVVTVLKECCAKAPFNTKTLLTQSPSYIRTELEKITNNSDAYKRMRARKKNQANRLAAASGSKDNPKSSSSPVSQAPPPGSENQSASGPETQPATEGPEFKVPKTPATAADQSKSKKRKGFGHSYGSVYFPDFDVVGFTDEFIMENSRVAMDEAGLKSNLEYMMKAGIKAAAISRALQKKLAECPPTSRTELE
ncbi:hypothetical protein PIB30_087033 [Stylosanthes scabra]|uniref:Uncharacterized protein n=1 Tax=Stylosanthes scabra TaxID=79078 RepID=A0ABU6ZRX1_9FABA|nr:hypothetical protein [Stylosanthes scabra]